MLPGVERTVIRLKRGLWPVAAASLDNFVLGDGISIDFRDIWDRHLAELSPFCLDTERNQVVFVRVPGDVDLAAMPFYYHAQRTHAIKTYSLGFEQFHALAEELADDGGNTGFLFSTGRCGSTLLARLLESSPEVSAISEPDVFTQVATSNIPQDEAGKIIRHTTRFLSTIHRHRCPATRFVVIKLRSQCVYRGEVFRHADPRCRNLFLYRNAIDVVNSFYALLPGWARAVFSHIPVDHWILSSARAQTYIARLCPLFLDERFSDLPRSYFNFCVLMWLAAMESAIRLQAGDEVFFETVLRYEDLQSHRVAAVAPLYKLWHVEPPGVESQKNIFETDVLTRSRMESRGIRVLSQQDEEKIRSIVARHSQIRSPEFSLSP